LFRLRPHHNLTPHLRKAFKEGNHLRHLEAVLFRGRVGPFGTNAERPEIPRQGLELRPSSTPEKVRAGQLLEILFDQAQLRQHRLILAREFTEPLERSHQGMANAHHFEDFFEQLAGKDACLDPEPAPDSFEMAPVRQPGLVQVEEFPQEVELKGLSRFLPAAEEETLGGQFIRKFPGFPERFHEWGKRPLVKHQEPVTADPAGGTCRGKEPEGGSLTLRDHPRVGPNRKPESILAECEALRQIAKIPGREALLFPGSTRLIPHSVVMAGRSQAPQCVQISTGSQDLPIRPDHLEAHLQMRWQVLLVPGG